MKDHLCDLDAADRVLECKPLAPATYCGRMVDGETVVELWTLTDDIDGHPIGSTVSESTLRRAGFAIPNRKVNP